MGMADGLGVAAKLAKRSRSGENGAASLPRVLVVDDDSSLRRLMSLALRSRYEVLEAGSGEEAQSVLERTNALGATDSQVALVLLDVMMPGVDGFISCRRIKKEFGIPVIMVTARSSAGDVRMALESGADDYIVKPFECSALLTKVTQHMAAPAVAVPCAEQPAVLIVDDDANMRRLMAIVLRRRYTVIEASTPEEALRQLERGATMGAARSLIRVVLLDVMLPQIDGFALCELIKSDFRVRVIMVTSRNGQDDLHEALSAGADDYLTKPFSYQLLLEKVARQLDVSNQDSDR